MGQRESSWGFHLIKPLAEEWNVVGPEPAHAHAQ